MKQQLIVAKRLNSATMLVLGVTYAALAVLQNAVYNAGRKRDDRHHALVTDIVDHDIALKKGDIEFHRNRMEVLQAQLDDATESYEDAVLAHSQARLTRAKDINDAYWH